MSMNNVEDICALSPLQQGLLFHCLYDGAGSGLYLEQFGIPISGAIDPENLRRAWQGVLDRHSILRTAFLWEDLSSPVQVVNRRLPIPFAVHDFSTLDEDARLAAVTRFRAEDRQRGFDLG